MNRLVVVLFVSLFFFPSLADAQAVYVGSKACGQCHTTQFESFSKYSKKSHSWNSIAVMIPKLTQEEINGCYECHTTGYKKPGGFVSKDKTPDLSYVGCETCHGPGSAHAANGDPKLIQAKPKLSDCVVCHNPQRVADFKFKPLVASGAH
nr:cytochrome c family protein [Fundidesulfovibrio soli]